MISLLGRKQQPLIGVDISSTSVKLLELSKAGKSYKVESYAVEPLPANAVVEKRIEDMEAVTQAVQRAHLRSGAKNKNAAVAVSGAQVITKVITMPAGMSDSDMENQIRTEADQYIPYPMDEVSLDFCVLNPTEGKPDQVDVLLAATQTQNVDDRRAVLDGAGLVVKVVDVEAYTGEHAFALLRHQVPDEGVDRVVALVDIGATGTSITILHDGKLVFTRDLQFGGKQLTEEIMRRYGLTYEEAGQKKRQGGLPNNYEQEVLGPFKEQAVQQINRALQFFYSNSNFNSVEQLLLCGGTGTIAGLDSFVEARMGVPVAVADPLKGMVYAARVKMERLAGDAPAMITALGLAMRSFD